MNQRKLVLPALAVILALVTTAVVVGYLQTLQRRAVVPPSVPMAAVLVAKRTIPTRSIIGRADVEVRRLAAAGVHPRALSRVDDAVNRVAVTTIFEGQQVLSDMVATANVGSSLSYVVPAGLRAVTLAVNEVVDVAGFISPGDRVDVVGTVTTGGTEMSRIFLQNILVLAAAQQADQKPGQAPKVTSSVTLALTPEQVEAFTQIDNNGKVRLALRPAGTSSLATTRGQTTASALGGATPPSPAVAAAAPSLPRVPPLPAPRVAAPTPVTIEIWRSTQKQTVQF